MGYLLLATVAAAGLLASFACHILGWLDITPPFGKSVFLLHIGIFVVWIPLVIFADRTMPKSGRGNFEHLLAETPKWERTASKFLFGYTFLNFAYFLYCTSKYPKHEVPFPVELRGISGHWMLFYGVSVIGFTSLARLAKKRKQNTVLDSNPAP